MRAAQYLEAGDFRKTLPERFRFELVSERHSEAIIRWRNDPENRDAFFAARRLTMEDQARFLEDYGSRDRVDFVLIDEEKRKAVGVFTLKELHTAAELGKLLGEKEYRGRGIARSATLAILQFGFTWLQLPEIVAQTQKANDLNIHLNLKLGFVIESEFDRAGTTYLRMRLTREQFLNRAN